MAAPVVTLQRRRWTTRAAVVGTVAALVGLPGAAHAAAGPDELRELATAAAQAVAEERAVIALGSSGSDAHGLADELAAADADGAALLGQLDAFGAVLSPAVRAALAPLGGETVLAPADAVYRSAIGDLLDLATASSPGPGTAVQQRGVSFGVLAMVALTFVALGLTALLFTLRSARPRRELSALAWSDALTGLANRRRLDHDLRELASGETTGRGRHPVSGPTAVIMVDIDHFKDVNDCHGHRFGDDVLRAVGAMLTREVRRDDVVYRYGGEEFCIVLPGAADDQAARVAERILVAARRLELPGGVRVTLSAGVADGSGADVERTLHAADDALLTAKRTGRDRTAAALTLA